MAGLLDVLDLGAGNIAELDDPAVLRVSVDHLLSVLDLRFRGYSLYAASPHAERVIGAAMILDPTVRVGGTEATAIVGINLASGTQLARAATRLRDNGNRHALVGIVLHALLPEWSTGMQGWTVPELSELYIQNYPSVPSAGQHCGS